MSLMKRVAYVAVSAGFAVAGAAAATRELCGLNDAATEGYGTCMLRARRLAERGVRFVQVISGPQEIDGEERNWDGHDNLEGNHRVHARAVDKPIAGLLADLKSRGLLESTLVRFRAVDSAQTIPRCHPIYQLPAST